jgi:hypothetical protein
MSYYHLDDSYFVNNRSFDLGVIGVSCFVWCVDDNYVGYYHDNDVDISIVFEVSCCRVSVGCRNFDCCLVVSG